MAVWKKKNLTENLQVSNEGMMQLAFKAIKYMGLEERLQITKMKIYMLRFVYKTRRYLKNCMEQASERGSDFAKLNMKRY